MDGFQVCLSIKDSVCDAKCFRNTVQRDILVTSSTQTITLQNGYLLNIVAVSSTSFTILIQNGVQIIIRNISPNYTTEICLPSRCVCHALSLTGTIIQVT